MAPPTSALLLLLAASASASASAAVALAVPDLSGANWELRGASYVETYSIAAAAGKPDAFVATCTGPPPHTCGWLTAAIQGAPGDNATVSVTFDNGHESGGTASADLLQWNDGSSWGRQRPAGAPIVVHVVPTTHMDPGWFESVDVLFERLFRHTFDNATAALAAGAARTFVSEIAVIPAMWVGVEGGEPARERLAALVAEGRFEFAGGGWVQPDETITRFEDLVDGTTLGHLFAQSVLGAPPVRVGWSADPFGHSSSMAYLAALNAYDAHVLGRPMSPLDPINTQAGTLWHPVAAMPDAGVFDPASTVLTTTTLGYWEPYRSMINDMVGGGANLTRAADTLLSYAQAAAARSPFVTNVLVMLGDDAPLQQPWSDAYPALDSVLAALNARSGQTNATFAYSTPSRWVKALASEKIQWPARPAWDAVPLVGNEFP